MAAKKKQNKSTMDAAEVKKLVLELLDDYELDTPQEMEDLENEVKALNLRVSALEKKKARNVEEPPDA